MPEPVDRLIARTHELLPGAPAEAAALWVWARRAGRLVEAFTRDELAGDVDMSELIVLLNLWFRGSPSTPGELADEVVLTQSGIARAIQRATADGTVRKSAHPDDGRAQVIELTAKGRKLVERVMTSMLDRFQEHLGLDDPAELRRLAETAFRVTVVLEGAQVRT